MTTHRFHHGTLRPREYDHEMTTMPRLHRALTCNKTICISCSTHRALRHFTREHHKFDSTYTPFSYEPEAGPGKFQLHITAFLAFISSEYPTFSHLSELAPTMVLPRLFFFTSLCIWVNF